MHFIMKDIFWCTLTYRVYGLSNLEGIYVCLIFQCVEYFQEWSLNPPNYAFDEIRKGEWYDLIYMYVMG